MPEPAETFEARATRPTARSSSDQPCADYLDSCPGDGCEHPGTPHALVNNMKRKVPPASATPTWLTFLQFACLQETVDDMGITLGVALA